MELVYRIREARLDRQGRATVTADLHWSGGRLQLSTGVKVLPTNWQPAKKQQINTREADANGKNLALARFSTKLTKVFTDASSAERAEKAITADELRAAVGLGEPEAAPEPAPLPLTQQPLGALYQRWREENQGLASNTLRRYQQVVTHLAAWRPKLTLDTLTRKAVSEYQVYLQKQGLADSTFTNHVKFLRECYRTAGLNPPAYLKWRSPDARPVALTADELRQLIDYPFSAAQGHLAQERDAFVFQTLLLLRDSDLRRLRAGYVKEVTLLLGQPPVLVASMPQQKTTEELAAPFPPLAAALWRTYGGRLPIVSQQKRNARMKEMAAVVGLTREIIKVRWVAGQMHETPLPLCEALTSHAARHTGADMLLTGSGDRNLVEIGLGHVNYVYGHDSIYRYGPQLLAAWAQVLAGITTVGSGEICQRQQPTSAPKSATLAA
jgi:integrase